MSKLIDFKFEGSKLKANVNVDPNGDGEPVMVIAVEIELAEIPDEVMSLITKKKSEAKA